MNEVRGEVSIECLWGNEESVLTFIKGVCCEVMRNLGWIRRLGWSYIIEDYIQLEKRILIKCGRNKEILKDRKVIFIKYRFGCKVFCQDLQLYRNE